MEQQDPETWGRDLRHWHLLKLWTFKIPWAHQVLRSSVLSLLVQNHLSWPADYPLRKTYRMTYRMISGHSKCYPNCLISRPAALGIARVRKTMCYHGRNASLSGTRSEEHCKIRALKYLLSIPASASRLSLEPLKSTSVRALALGLELRKQIRPFRKT